MRWTQREQLSARHPEGSTNQAYPNKVKLGDKECFDKEKIGFKEPFPVTNCQFTS